MVVVAASRAARKGECVHYMFHRLPRTAACREDAPWQLQLVVSVYGVLREPSVRTPSNSSSAALAAARLDVTTKAWC